MTQATKYANFRHFVSVRRDRGAIVMTLTIIFFSVLLALVIFALQQEGNL